MKDFFVEIIVARFSPSFISFLSLKLKITPDLFWYSSLLQRGGLVNSAHLYIRDA
jgi:hypothetical protein